MLPTKSYLLHCAVTSNTVLSCYVDRVLFIIEHCQLQACSSGRDKRLS